METNDWRAAADAIVGRAQASARTLREGFPHWANADSGAWTTTPDGDWTGGAFPGILWLGHSMNGDDALRALALEWCMKLRPRAKLETAFKGFGFYCGAALGEMLAGDRSAGELALDAASSLVQQYDPALGLIPLGKDAEEHGEVGRAFSSIDSLQASPLLFWAARRTGEQRYRDAAIRHTSRVLDVHLRADGSIIQSSELDASTGAVTRTFTHKGSSDTSTWGRAQAWGMLYSAMAYSREPSQARWLEQSMAAADWWLARVPADMVSYWDFDDSRIPDAPRDTAATSIVCAALLRLGELAPAPARGRYRDAAERTARALVAGYVTPLAAGESRPAGMLVGGCFNNRADGRSQDRVTYAELIFGTYFLLECLQVLTGRRAATEI